MPDYLEFSSVESDEELIEIKHHDGGLILKQENQICMCKKICINFFYPVISNAEGMKTKICMRIK